MAGVIDVNVPGWDELCMLCGIWTNPSPLLVEEDIEELAEEVVDELEDESAAEVVQEGLASYSEDHVAALGFVPAWCREKMAHWGYSTDKRVAVGYFDPSSGGVPVRDGRIPDGRRVEVRRVVGGGAGSFSTVLRTQEDQEIKVTGVLTLCTAALEEGNPNPFFCERCYAYLRAWVDWQALPPHCSAVKNEPLSFQSELFEIVNSREKARRQYFLILLPAGRAAQQIRIADASIPDETTGLLPAINYDRIEDSLEEFQDSFLRTRRGVRYLADAVRAGIRGKDLIPPLLRDCRAWMFMRPDIWPKPSGQDDARAAVQFNVYATGPNAIVPRLGTLPNELILQILHDVPLPSILAISATCRSLRCLITDRTFLDRVLKAAINGGGLRWILPLPDLLDEEQRACDAIRHWLVAADPSITSQDQVAEDCSKDTAASLLMSPRLDLLAFIRGCWDSDSMMNRKRLWGQVKQFQTLWVDYRLHGWERDRFYSSDDLPNNG